MAVMSGGPPPDVGGADSGVVPMTSIGGKVMARWACPGAAMSTTVVTADSAMILVIGRAAMLNCEPSLGILLRARLGKLLQCYPGCFGNRNIRYFTARSRTAMITNSARFFAASLCRSCKQVLTTVL